MVRLMFPRDCVYNSSTTGFYHCHQHCINIKRPLALRKTLEFIRSYLTATFIILMKTQ